MTVLRPSAVRVGLDRLQHVRMVADDHRGSRIEHLVRQVDIFGPRRGRVLDAPVDGDDQQIALRACRFHGGEHLRLVRTRRAARLAGIGKEIHVRLVVLVGIAIAVEPARHAQPAHLDAVGLGDHRLPGLSTPCRPSRQTAGRSRADARGFPQIPPSPGPSRGYWRMRRS